MYRIFYQLHYKNIQISILIYKLNFKVYIMDYKPNISLLHSMKHNQNQCKASMSEQLQNYNIHYNYCNGYRRKYYLNNKLAHNKHYNLCYLNKRCRKSDIRCITINKKNKMQFLHYLLYYNNNLKGIQIDINHLQINKVLHIPCKLLSLHNLSNFLGNLYRSRNNIYLIRNLLT